MGRGLFMQGNTIKGIKSTGSDLSGNFTFTADDLRIGEGNYQDVIIGDGSGSSRQTT